MISVTFTPDCSPVIMQYLFSRYLNLFSEGCCVWKIKMFHRR